MKITKKDYKKMLVENIKVFPKQKKRKSKKNLSEDEKQNLVEHREKYYKSIRKYKKIFHWVEKKFFSGNLIGWVAIFVVLVKI